MKLYELRPKPCGHEHETYRSLYECLEVNGVPGFESVEVRL